MNELLYFYLKEEFKQNNVPKYQKYFEEWIYNITFAQKEGFYKSMYAINK